MGKYEVQARKNRASPTGVRLKLEGVVVVGELDSGLLRQRGGVGGSSKSAGFMGSSMGCGL